MGIVFIFALFYDTFLFIPEINLFYNLKSMICINLSVKCSWEQKIKENLKK